MFRTITAEEAARRSPRMVRLSTTDVWRTNACAAMTISPPPRRSAVDRPGPCWRSGPAGRHQDDAGPGGADGQCEAGINVILAEMRADQRAQAPERARRCQLVRP
jgi:hypothetical protein